MKTVLLSVAVFLLAQASPAAQFITDGFDFPVDFPDGPAGGIYVITQEFLTSGPCGGGLKTVFHPGDDYDAPGPTGGEPIQAAGHGSIVFAEEGDNNGYGNLVVVQHVGEFRIPDDNGNDSGKIVVNPQTVYAHLEAIALNPLTGVPWRAGETILRGERVGDLGGTPSYVPHLHFEVRLRSLEPSTFYPCGRDEAWVKTRYTFPRQFIELNRPTAGPPSAGRCTGAGHVDQGLVFEDEIPCANGAGIMNSSPPIGQEFVPTNENLSAVEVRLEEFNRPFEDSITIRIHEGSIFGQVIGSATELVTADNTDEVFFLWHQFNFNPVLQLIPGNLYVLEIVVTNSSFARRYTQHTCTGCGWYIPECDYKEGHAIFKGELQTWSDILFATCSP